MERRDFLKNSALAASAITLGVSGVAQASLVAPARPMIKKSLKWGMVKGDMSIMDKFKMLKEIGYDGVELDSPHTLDHKEILAARDKTGLELPEWSIRSTGNRPCRILIPKPGPSAWNP